MNKGKVRPSTTLGQGDTGGEGVLAPSPSSFVKDL